MWWLIPLIILVGFLFLSNWERVWLAWQRRLARDHRLGPEAATQEEVGRTLERVWAASGAWNGLEVAMNCAAYFAPILDLYREPLTAELRRRAASGHEIARMTAEELGLSLEEA